ncbi:MAG: class I SAM-dependent methyltransferase [Bacteroidetes bacterium]|nr:class I SAM-dependent methyltransferase [Bacteroidota bacterium]
MQYDPIKRMLGSFFNKAPWMRILFYKILDLLLLRSWHIRRELRRWNKARTNDAVTVLDAGFGFGQYSYFLTGLGKNIRVKGLDLKEEQVEDCNRFFKSIQRNNITFFSGDLTQYVEYQAYDLILCVDVMEHILEDSLVFKNFSSSVKPGGRLYISTPSDQGGSDVHDHGDESFIGEHVRDGYNLEDISEKLKTAGFSSVVARYSYGKYGKISWKLSMKYPILMVNVSKLFLILLPFYYLLTFPFCLILNAMDVSRINPTGTGLIVMATK